jgi:hypothetical protein
MSRAPLNQDVKPQTQNRVSAPNSSLVTVPKSSLFLSDISDVDCPLPNDGHKILFLKSKIANRQWQLQSSYGQDTQPSPKQSKSLSLWAFRLTSAQGYRMLLFFIRSASGER